MKIFKSDKFLQLSILSIIFTLSCCSQRASNDRVKLKLNGRVKTINQQAYKATYKSGEVVLLNVVYDIYDRNSLIQFNDNGDILSIKLINLDGLVGSDVYDFSVNANQKFPLNGHTLENMKNFDNEVFYYNNDGTVNFKIVNTFDLNNNLQEARIVEPGGILNAFIKYKYDRFGNVTQINEYMPKFDKTSVTTIAYRYDSSNNWTQKISSYNGNLFIVIVRKIEYF